MKITCFSIECRSLNSCKLFFIWYHIITMNKLIQENRSSLNNTYYIATRCTIFPRHIWIYAKINLATALGGWKSLGFRNVGSSYESFSNRCQSQHAVYAAASCSSSRSLSSIIIYVNAGNSGGYITASVGYVCFDIIQIYFYRNFFWMYAHALAKFVY